MDRGFKEDTMMNVDASLQEFIRRVDALISMAKGKRQQAIDMGEQAWIASSYDTFIRNLNALRDTANQDKLPRPSRGETRPGAGLGLSRAVGEWSEDDELLGAVRDVEDYFRASL